MTAKIGFIVCLTEARPEFLYHARLFANDICFDQTTNGEKGSSVVDKLSIFVEKFNTNGEKRTLFEVKFFLLCDISTTYYLL